MTQEKIFYVHPEYESEITAWNTYHDLYEGRHDALIREQYLWPHDLEQRRFGPIATGDVMSETPLQQHRLEAERIRRNRERRTQYSNFIDPLVNIWTQIFFKNDLVIPDNLTETLNELGALDDIDGEGSSLSSFIRDKVLFNELLYGRPIILVDAPSDAAMSERDAQERNLRPFFEIIDPRMVKDWQIERQDSARVGRFNFFRYEFEAVEDRTGPDVEPKIKNFTKVYIKQDTGYIVQKFVEDPQSENATDVNKTVWSPVTEPIHVTQIEEIPIAFSFDGDSWIKSAAPQALRHYNLESNLDNVRYYQGYQLRYVTGFDTAPDEQKLAVAAYTMFFLPENATAGTLEPADTGSLERGTEMAMNQLFKIGLNQPFQTTTNTRQVEAADTQREKKETQISTVQARAGDLEDVINQAVDLFFEFRAGADRPDDSRIRFDSDAGALEIDNVKETYALLRNVLPQIPNTHKQILNALLKDLPLENPDEVAEEIEETEFVGSLAVQQRRDVGQTLRNFVNGTQ